MNGPEHPRNASSLDPAPASLTPDRPQATFPIGEIGGLFFLGSVFPRLRRRHIRSARDRHRLIALGLACWPGTPLIGMLTYSAAVTLYLAYLGLAGGMKDILLWPAVVLHVILTALLIRALRRGKETKTE
jgi:hypothetical protein